MTTPASPFAFVFPGQGSQFPGMGAALAEAFPEARAVFAEVDDALGEALSRLIFEGPEETLRLTANTQPALMAVSVAAMRALASAHGITSAHARFVAGHSLGEYAALVAAGALSLSDGARLLRLRGQAMQRAVAPGQGGMAALLGADPDQADALCAAAIAEAGGVCESANDNAPGQIVISGTLASVEAACRLASAHGVKKAMMLAVSAPFHCSLMAPAAAEMRAALATTVLRPPVTDLMANVTALPTRDPEAIRANLIAQVTGRVRWRESVEAMAAAGVRVMVEAGAGKVLTVMNRRTAKEIEGTAMGTPEEVAAVGALLTA
jgi:[acyl-carrier-protein] S-malonyltransferase